jgi:hypothetical protein
MQEQELQLYFINFYLSTVQKFEQYSTWTIYNFKSLQSFRNDTIFTTLTTLFVLKKIKYLYAGFAEVQVNNFCILSPNSYSTGTVDPLFKSLKRSK